MSKEYHVCLHDITFYKVDEDGYEECNKDGSIKVYRIKSDARFKPLEYICEDLDEDILHDSSPTYEQCLEGMLEKVFEALVGDNGLLKRRLKRLTTNPDEGMGGNSIEDVVNEIHRLKDIEYDINQYVRKYENETIKDFKDGVHDGLMIGVRDEDNYTQSYKEGYDFGIVLHTEIEEKQELENQELREKVNGEYKFYERRK